LPLTRRQLTHTWMQGALESALVAVREMLARADGS
jgi:monoamine oxidase